MKPCLNQLIILKLTYPAETGDLLKPTLIFGWSSFVWRQHLSTGPWFSSALLLLMMIQAKQSVLQGTSPLAMA
jgi:hypothetical protein